MSLHKPPASDGAPEGSPLWQRLAAVLLGITVLLLDLATKAWVERNLLWDRYPVIDEVLTFQYAVNRGIAFGFFHDSESPWKAPLLGLMAVAALLLVLYYIWTTPSGQWWVLAALGLLLGGIAGNFIDRLRDDMVVDFIKVHWGQSYAWPTFNVADAAITSGVIILLAATFWAPGQSDETEAVVPSEGPQS